VLDGKTVIYLPTYVPHLKAAFAVWQYAEASARLIFTEEEAVDPLERALLEKITATPGINRKKLHKAIGGHVQAQAMVNASASWRHKEKFVRNWLPLVDGPANAGGLFTALRHRRSTSVRPKFRRQTQRTNERSPKQWNRRMKVRSLAARRRLRSPHNPVKQP
jgi:hypothetical protein